MTANEINVVKAFIAAINRRNPSDTDSSNERSFVMKTLSPLVFAQH